jgi:hypothetical protein
MISQKVLGLVCAELVRSALSSIATRRNHTDQDITDMVLELDSDTHSSEDEDTSAQSDSDTTDTNFTHWTDNTNC